MHVQAVSFAILSLRALVYRDTPINSVKFNLFKLFKLHSTNVLRTCRLSLQTRIVRLDTSQTARSVSLHTHANFCVHNKLSVHFYSTFSAYVIFTDPYCEDVLTRRQHTDSEVDNKSYRANGNDSCRAEFVNETSATFSLAHDNDIFISQKTRKRIATTTYGT